jgi:hypothetical protein
VTYGWTADLAGAARRWKPSGAALAFSVVAAAAFTIARPPVGDFWAAKARQSAALHGVGLDYWFSWFGGTVPGHYSVLSPLLSRFVDAGLLGAASTVVVTVLCHRLVRGSRHAALATWTAALAATASLWSGRIPFALGSALMLVAFLCVRGRRTWLAACTAVLTALLAPVSGAFLALGLCGVIVHDRSRRRTGIAAAAASLASLGALAGYFGMPGPEGFPVLHAALAGATLLAMLPARPVNYVRTVVLLSLPLLVLLTAVPNGMGTNFERFTWLCLPAAVVATAQVRPGRAVLAAGGAVACAVIGSAHDLYVAAEPMSSTAYLTGLVSELDRTPALTNYRVEVVPDGTHVAAYALLGHAMLARGYETQADNAFDAVLESPSLDAGAYRRWLAANAVGYVALDRMTLKRGPEDELVRSGSVPFLRLVWSDAHWQLFKVIGPTPIVEPPARIVDADQAQLTLAVPTAGEVPIRVHWSRLLKVDGPAEAKLHADKSGWTVLQVPRPGTYAIGG